MQAIKETTSFPDKTFPINIFFLPVNGHPLVRSHWHSHMEWLYLLSGQARVQIDAKFIDVGQGDLIYINSNQVHGYTFQEQTKAVAIVTNECLIRNSFLDSTEARYILPILERTINIPNVFDPSDPVTINICKSIEELIQEFVNKNVGYELIIKSKLYYILGLMVRLHQSGQERCSPVGNDSISAEIRILLQHLEKNYHHNISINDAAKMINVSPSHFYRLFKRVTGKTFIEYMNVLRINKAEALLSDINLTVTEIAEKVGFGSVAYFGRVFRDNKNISPTDYRKRVQRVRLIEPYNSEKPLP